MTVGYREVEQNEPLRIVAAAHGVSHETIRRLLLQKPLGQSEASWDTCWSESLKTAGPLVCADGGEPLLPCSVCHHDTVACGSGGTPGARCPAKGWLAQRMRSAPLPLPREASASAGT